ncbi:MAG TPA: hypothetical protein VFF79_01120 [Conexibacter sp.]|nr:hypothetical protein [Conexibacter sp.]
MLLDGASSELAPTAVRSWSLEMNPDSQPCKEADALDAFARWFVDWWRRRGSRLVRADGEQAEPLSTEDILRNGGGAGSPPQTRDL